MGDYMVWLLFQTTCYDILCYDCYGFGTYTQRLSACYLTVTSGSFHCFNNYFPAVKLMRVAKPKLWWFNGLFSVPVVAIMALLFVWLCSCGRCETSRRGSSWELEMLYSVGYHDVVVSKPNLRAGNIWVESNTQHTCTTLHYWLPQPVLSWL